MLKLTKSEGKVETNQNTIYKKRAIEYISKTIQQQKFKKVLFLAGKTAYQNFGSLVTNELAKVEVEFVLKLIPSIVSVDNINSCLEFTNNCDLVIALGGGSVCDISKVVATKTNLPLIIIPSIPTTTAYFTNYAFVYENGTYKKTNTKPAFKILIDENIIVKSDKKYVIEGQKFVLSHFETLFTNQFDNLFYDTKKDYSCLKLQLCKFKDNYEYFQSDTDDSKLVLMDILVELATCFEDYSSNNVYSFAFCLKANSDISFSSLCLMCSKILSNIYLSVFSLKNLYIFSLPNFESIEKSLNSLKIQKKQVNFLPIKKLLNNAVFIKVNSIKNQVHTLCENLSKDMEEYKLPPNKMTLNIDNFYKTFNVAPVVYNCSSAVNLIYGAGLMNF